MQYNEKDMGDRAIRWLFCGLCWWDWERTKTWWR